MPSGVAQGVQHLRPHGCVALAVLGQPGRVDLECEAHPTHESSTVDQRACGAGWSGPTGGRSAPTRPDQKLNWSMLPELNVNGFPSSTVASLPTVNSPSLPALNLSPSLPVMMPEARAAPAYAAR